MSIKRIVHVRNNENSHNLLILSHNLLILILSHNLLILKLFQTCMNFFLLLNTKEDILKNVIARQSFFLL